MDKISMGNTIKALRDRKGMTQVELARRLDIAPGNISKYETGAGMPEFDRLEPLADALGLSVSELFSKAETGNVEDAPPLRTFRDMPIVGTVQGGDNGFFTELEYPIGQGDGNITYPAKDGATYALRVKGDSMRPRIKNGEFIVIEPHHEPQPGDDVVVCLRDGRKLVKELLYTRDGEVTLGSINNGHGNLTFTLAEIEKIHYVAAIVPRGAFYKPGNR